MKTVTLHGATMRDLSYVASRLRADDREELDAQHPGWTPAVIAAAHLSGYGYIACVDGNPEAAFGAIEQRAGLWIIWSFGTDLMWRCAPRIRHFGATEVLPQLLDDGAQRAEARALLRNRFGNGLLKALGATRRCELPGYGVHGETFVLWDWTRETVDVLQDTRTPEAAEAA